MKIKKWLTMAAAIMTASCMLFSFAACGETADVDDPNNGENQGSQQGGNIEPEVPDKKDPAAPDSQGGGLSKPGETIDPGFDPSGGSSGGDEHTHSEKPNADQSFVELENGIKLRLFLEEKQVTGEDGEPTTVYEETDIYYVSDGDACKEDTVTIPTEYEGKKVTTIGNLAFEDNSYIKKVIIPEGIVEIQGSAFSYCTKLEEVEIQGKTLTTIGSSAFAHSEKLTTINIPDSVTKTGTFVFAHCKALETVELPATLSDVGDGMFYECRGLKSIVLPTAMTEIPSTMFGNCVYLEEVKLHEGIEEIGVEAFYGCKSFKSITLPKSIKVLRKGAFLACSNLKEIHYAGTTKEWLDEKKITKENTWDYESYSQVRDYKTYCDGDKEFE